MGQEDYNQVIEKTHLTDGSVWSIPITLPVTEDVASKLEIGDHIALYGEDGALYGTLKLTEKYRYDKKRGSACLWYDRCKTSWCEESL